MTSVRWCRWGRWSDDGTQLFNRKGLLIYDAASPVQVRVTNGATD